jgi:ribosomal protein S18 acetylase RimI-like enzyme
MIHFEEMSLNAWPALNTAVYRGCLFRSSAGYTNRANSANPLYSKADDIESIADYAESFYARQSFPSTFKILEADRYRAMDEELERREYGKVTETAVMKVDLDNFTEKKPDGVVVTNHFYNEWTDSFLRCNDILPRNAETARAMLRLITANVVVASIVENGDIIACGYGAIENGYVGFFDIVVEKEHRSKGHGRTLMNGIISAAKARGAQTGYLQVVQTNETAKSLYRSLGFDPVYTYWYRKRGSKA